MKHTLLLVKNKNKTYLLTERNNNPNSDYIWRFMEGNDIYETVWITFGINLRDIEHKITHHKSNIYIVTVNFEDIMKLWKNNTINPNSFSRGGKRKPSYCISLINITKYDSTSNKQ